MGKILERQEHAVEEPGAELTEAVVALERRQVGDAEEFPVLGEEGEESLRKSGCGIATLPRRVGDEDSELTAPGIGEFIDQREDGRLDVGEVLVKGRRARIRPPRDVDHGEIAVRTVGDRGSGGGEQSLAGRLTAATRDPPIGGAWCLIGGEFSSRIAHGERG